MSAHSPGLLTGNPPPRWGAPGEDLALIHPGERKRGATGSGTDCDDRDPRGISATKGHHLDE